MKKKILIVDPADFLGGAELFMVDVVQAFVSAQALRKICTSFEVHLVTSGNKDYLERYKGLPVTFHVLKLPRLKPISPITLGKFLVASKKLAKLIDKINPELVCTNSVRAHIVASRAVQKTKAKLLWFLHDFTFPGFLLKRLIKIPTKVIANSQAVKGSVLESVGQEFEQKIEVIPNGIDLEKVKVQNTNFKMQNVKVGIVGRIVPWKGQEYFLRAAPLILEKVPEARFVIVGEAHAHSKESMEYEKKLRNLVKELGIEDKVDFRGYIKSVYDEISSWKVLVHASIEPEPLGRVILEGMALGTVVVATDIGGPREILENGVDGYLVEPENSEEIAEKVTRLLLDQKNCSKIAEKAYEKVKSRYSLEKIAGKIGEVFQRITS